MIKIGTYIGDTVRISMTSTGLDGTVLVPSLVNNVTITLFDNQATPAQIKAETNMSYSTTNAYWYYDWATTGQVAGTYNAKVKIYGLGATPAFVNFEYIRIRLAQPRTA